MSDAILGVNSAEHVPVARTADVPEGEIRGFVVSERRVAIANTGRGYHAFLASCPHQGAPLDEGRLWGSEIDCPRHHYLFDVRSGKNVYPRRVFPADLAERLRPLVLCEVRVREGMIEIRLPA